MSDQLSGKATTREQAIEHEALKDYNEEMKGKVVPQNHNHNARKEGFDRKEEHWNN